jgi:hypothetical protein
MEGKMKTKRFVLFFGRILPLILIFLFVLGGSMIGREFQRQIMEYYIYFKPEAAQQGYPQRVERAFATKKEAEEARQKMARDIGTHREGVVGGIGIESVNDAAREEFFLANSYIKEVPTGRYTAATSTPTPSAVKPAANPANSGKQEVSDSERDDLLRRLKKETSTTSFDGDNRDLTGRLKSGTSTSSFNDKNANLGTRLKSGTASDKDEVTAATVELAKMEPATMRSVKTSIAQRQVEPNPWARSISRSLKIKAPPLPEKMFSQLQPGDVLLVAPPDTLTFDAWIGHYIRLFDKLSSWEWKSRASHCFIYLREVNGVKLFQDNLPGEGFRIKTEDQINEEYAGRYMDIAQPLNRVEANGLWAAARELGIRQLNADLKKLSEPDLVSQMNKWTKYGLVGDDNLVCSESARFALVMAGLEIAQTDSLLKKLIGIYFGPANFYSDKQNFLITPLASLRNRPKE